MAELVEPNGLPNLIQKFDSDAVLLPCFCRTLFLDLAVHGRSPTSEMGLRYTASIRFQECDSKSKIKHQKQGERKVLQAP